MALNTTVGRYGTGTLQQVLAPVRGLVLVLRDGQSNQAYATAQYSGFAVGDRVTILTIGTQMYATGKL